MPYYANSDLRSSVQAHLPPHAQDIYRAAFNHSYAAHAGDARQEEIAHRIAWAAVKRSYIGQVAGLSSASG
ncbi:ChaB family protein [Paraburkholderia sp. 35.1]|uniref:ChaB family protein n=1 Tax=Paraburkholderia sp. 35.1 TaxID=2991058 RepID=UPI003D2203B0